MRLYFAETFVRTFVDVPAGGALEIVTRADDDGTDPLVLVWTGKPFIAYDGILRLEPFPDSQLGVCYAPRHLSTDPPDDSPSTLPPIGGYCATDAPGAKSEA